MVFIITRYFLALEHKSMHLYTVCLAQEHKNMHLYTVFFKAWSTNVCIFIGFRDLIRELGPGTSWEPPGGHGTEVLKMSFLGASWGHLAAKAQKC